MYELIGKLFKKLHKGQSGQTFVLVLILLLLAGLIIAPLAALINTNLKTGMLFEDKADQFYAADAGIEDGLWQVRNDQLPNLFDGSLYTLYDPYDYGTIYGPYPLAQQVNNYDVAVTINNIWIPSDISTPTSTQASNIINALKLVVTSRATSNNFIPAGEVFNGTTYYFRGSYEIDIIFTPQTGELAQNLFMNSLGIWLPPGYVYYTGSGDLETGFGQPYYSVPAESSHSGSQAVLWSFSGVSFDEMPAVSAPGDLRSTISFQYYSNSAALPQGLSWTTTNGFYANTAYSWDSDTRVYRVHSDAGDTGIDAYTIRGGLTELAQAITGDYFATGNSLLATTTDYRFRDDLSTEAEATVITSSDQLAGISDDAVIVGAYLYWTGWIDYHGYDPGGGGGITTLYTENCSSFDDTPAAWPVTWTDGSWSISSGRFAKSGTSSDILTMNSSLNLSSYSGQVVILSWDQTQSSIESGDSLYFQYYNGSSWDPAILVFNGPQPDDTVSYTIPSQYLTNNFRIRFYTDFSYSNDTVYIDNITITVSTAVFYDNADNFSSPPVAWTNGSEWSAVSGEFRGTGGGAGSSNYLTSGNINLSAYSGEDLAISWSQNTSSVESSDYFYFQMSGNGGSSWSSQIYVFNGNTSSTFSYNIPSAYVTSSFRIRFITDFSYSNDTVYIDNITISEAPLSLELPNNPTDEDLEKLVHDAARVDTVMFGTTDTNAVQIYAENYKLVEPVILSGGSNVAAGTWAYCMVYDATDLVLDWINTNPGNINQIEDNGAATYTLGHAYVNVANEGDPGWSFSLSGGDTTGYPLGIPAQNHSDLRYQNSYCGWSLILIYSSPETAGHQLYLYDVNNPGFTFAQARQTNLDFDGDGSPGGSITGFLAPDSIVSEDYAARMTIFVAEGDDFITGDLAILNGDNLSNSASPSNNVWNSQSPGLVIPGVDIDTFTAEYPTILPGDTTTQLDLPTQDDGIHIIYIILSFRSEVTSGGAITFLLTG